MRLHRPGIIIDSRSSVSIRFITRLALIPLLHAVPSTVVPFYYPRLSHRTLRPVSIYITLMLQNADLKPRKGERSDGGARSAHLQCPTGLTKRPQTYYYL